MSGSDGLGHSLSLRKQVRASEQRNLQRRERIHTLVTGIKLKITNRMVSPAVLLSAVGLGVFMEQTGRRRGWSLATALGVANTGIRLLLAVSSPARADSANDTKKI